MTDLEKLKALLDEWEVPYEPDEEDLNTIVLEAGWKDNSKVTGYNGFVTHFTFDENGGFIQIGIWE